MLNSLIIGLLLIGCKKPLATTISNTTKTNTIKNTVSVPPNIIETQQVNSTKIITYDSLLNLDAKIGQMIMVGINDRKVLALTDPLKKELLEQKIGGIILFEKNISKDLPKENLKKLIENLQSSLPIPLFMSIDEEGGQVHRLKEKYGFVPMPSAMYLGNLSSADSTYHYAKQLAEELDYLGFNINFAPVVDLSLNPNNTVIVKRERSYSEDPLKVTDHATAFIKAHRSRNVKTALKHFPGHGSSTTDTHIGLVDVTKQWQFKEFIPYKKLFDAGMYDAIVSCHVINCHLDTNCIPATLSKIITTDILRDLLGFKGVVFSDDMQMYAIKKNYGLEKSIAMAINAGVDVLVFGNNVSATDRITATEIHNVIRKLVDNGTISKKRIDEAYKRIMDLKYRKY